jgi:hypothetical protein
MFFVNKQYFVHIAPAGENRRNSFVEIFLEKLVAVRKFFGDACDGNQQE